MKSHYCIPAIIYTVEYISQYIYSYIMSKKQVSAFLLSHGSIDATYVPRQTERDTERDTEADIYNFSIDCRDLPTYTRLCMPNILGKPYYAHQTNTTEFIKSTINKWKKLQPSSSSFSDFIAGELTKFETDEVAAMVKLQSDCDKKDSCIYAQGHKMPPLEKEKRRSLSKATIQKDGIEWKELKCYIPEKHYNLTTRPDEQVLVVIETPGDDGVSTVSKIVETKGLILGRMNLAGVNKALRTKLGLSDTDEICFFDFVCNTFNFNGHPDLEQYLPNLLSYQPNPDGGATIIYGTITKDQCKRMKRAADDGVDGVGFGDDPSSQLTVGSQSASGGEGDYSPSSVKASATPLIYVTVPNNAISSIDVGLDVFGAGVAAGAGSQGGKRKHTKRKRNLKGSYRKTRVTRRRYNSRRFTKKNRFF